MTRNRAVDWLIGALGMLIVLIIAAVVAWWFISNPAAPESSSPTTTPVIGTKDPTGPPADLGKDEIWLGDMDVRSDLVVLPDSSLIDVEASGHGARSSRAGVVVERLEVEATIPFADVAAELGGDSRVSAAEDGLASVERTVEILGRQLRIVATGTVEARDGLLVVEPVTVDVGGPDALSRATAALVRQFVTIEQPIEGLPQNLVLQAVKVQDDGFRVHLRGVDVVLSDG